MSIHKTCKQYNRTLSVIRKKGSRTKTLIKSWTEKSKMNFDFAEDCRQPVISIVSEFNGGALECNCDMEGSLSYECSKFGGQCQCKPNVIGRQCKRCKPGFFGYPDCKQCNCPPTAQCNEETGQLGINFKVIKSGSTTKLQSRCLYLCSTCYWHWW